MREIKFRAWDGNKMLMSSNVGTQCFFDFWNMLLDKPLMQFTGLKDKNGLTEIYEGDCFSIDNKKTGTRIGIATVIWNERHLCYELEDTLNRGEYNLHWFAKNQPVIGNIYENKDLLK